MSPRSIWLAPALSALTATGAAAAPPPVDYVVIDPPPHRHAGGPHVIYLNRCTAGCTASAGDADSAVTNRSSILGRGSIPGSISLEPFQWDQATWDFVVACTRARYAPWDITVVTDEPTAGRYHEVMVAGKPSALGLAANTLGVAPLTSDCSPLGSAIAFAFANVHPAGATLQEELCTTVIHEAGHLFGLDHEFDCRDPMTYLPACGTKMFTNRSLPCGETTGERPCKCGDVQNSFTKLTSSIGAGADPAPPSVHIAVPADGATVARGFSVFVEAVDQRPIADMTLWINGRSWVRVPGKTSDSPYELRTPAEVPDGNLTLEVRTRDDLGDVGSATITVHKGAPCTDVSTCLAGQACTAGACVSTPGAGALGDGCATDDDCASKLCEPSGGAGVCTQPCYPAGASCAPGFTCRAADDESLACLVAVDDGGCCSTGGAPAGPALLAIAAGAALVRRRRRA